jgi:hypothetical protein
MVIDQQIKSSYEEQDMSPEEIAEDQGLDIVAVKAKLLQVSSKYRKASRKEADDEDRLNFSNTQLESVNDIIYETALSATHSDGTVDHRTRLAAATYIRDDKKGRKEARSVLAGTTFNILALNERLCLANTVSEKMLKDK